MSLNDFGLMLEAAATMFVVIGWSSTKRAHAVEASGGKPGRVPEWEEFGADDAERLRNSSAWLARNNAPGAYIGASARSRRAASWAITLALLGGACMLLDAAAGGGGGRP